MVLKVRPTNYFSATSQNDYNMLNLRGRYRIKYLLQLEYFMIPELPNTCNWYELRKTIFHLPLMKHKFAEQSLHYCLIKQLNRENGCILTSNYIESWHTLFLWLQKLYQIKHNTVLQWSLGYNKLLRLSKIYQ